jgi:carbon-monoxide dehydrogenase small subunit
METPIKKIAVTLTVNGSDHSLMIEPRRTLADALRMDIGCTGTHLGCEHGVCGACTVLVDRDPVRSCIQFAVEAEGADIRTIEDLAPSAEELHPLQEAFIRHHALQCGFCTPGFLMLVAGFCEKNRLTDDQEIVELLSSNLCRCTGYLPIVAAVKEYARSTDESR